MTKSARTAFIEDADYRQIKAGVYDALLLASSHDPDLLKRIEILERQVKQLSAKK